MVIAGGNSLQYLTLPPQPILAWDMLAAGKRLCWNGDLRFCRSFFLGRRCTPGSAGSPQRGLSRSLGLLVHRLISHNEALC